LGLRVTLVQACRPLVPLILLQQSPYGYGGRATWLRTMMHGLKLLKGRAVRLPSR